MKKAR